MAEFLNKNIRYLRMLKNMSQLELAEKTGVDRSTISRIENNEVETTVDNAIKIAEALNVSILDLVGTDMKTFDSDINKKYEYTKTISDEDGYTIEIKTDIPFEKLPKDEQQEMIDSAMEDLLKTKKEIRQKGE